MNKKILSSIVGCALVSSIFFAPMASAQEAAPAVASGFSPEATYVINSFMLLIFGMFVMFMSCGFAMLEAGMVRYKNVGVIVLKNFALYAIAAIVFYLFGYNLMYEGVDGGYIGSFGIWSPDDTAAQAGDYVTQKYASSAYWFFQMVFVATAASIVSGAVAERMKILTFFVFTACMSGFIYPIAASWKWGGGWLHVMGFQDFSGSTLVHSVGGWCALTAVWLTGARAGRFDAQGKSITILPSNVIAVCLGTFILWLGWLAFNGGSQLSFSTAADVQAISNIFVNTNAAAAGGVVIVMLFTLMMRKKIDVYLTLNGALAGLVSITAEPLAPTMMQATIIGAVGGMLMVCSTSLLERAKLDDVVGAIPVHLVCGVWGTLIVAWTNSAATLMVQLTGVVAYGLFSIMCSLMLWGVLKQTMGLRVDSMQEEKGLDIEELGLEGLPYLRSH
ncbi:MAG: ammonium transporter [Alphaproteobacteria bacterium]|nr:MAG: ammonium transporter [Alphaproteobacteria bacterium]